MIIIFFSRSLQSNDLLRKQAQKVIFELNRPDPCFVYSVSKITKRGGPQRLRVRCRGEAENLGLEH